MRHIILDRYTGKVESVCDIPLAYAIQYNAHTQQVIEGFDSMSFNLHQCEYYFNGVSFDEHTVQQEGEITRITVPPANIKENTHD